MRPKFAPTFLVVILMATAIPAWGQAAVIIRVPPPVGSTCQGRQATMVGTNGADELIGTPNDDVVVAGAGNDVIRTGEGNDVICADWDNDLIDPGLGNDFVDANEDHDHIVDIGGNDNFIGGLGRDAIDYSAGAGIQVDLAQGTASGVGTDQVTGVEDIHSTPGPDVVIGDASGNVFYDYGGSDTYSGAAGTDKVDYSQVDGPITVDLAKGSVTGAGGADELDSIEGVTGSKGGDTVLGTAGDEVFLGGPGNDVINGRGGFDTIDYSAAQRSLDVDLAEETATGQGNDTLKNLENVISGPFDDTIKGNGSENFMWDMGGDDLFDGRESFDMVNYVDAPSGIVADLREDTVTGGGGSDRVPGVEGLAGTAFPDILMGSDEHEMFAGGGDKDTIHGGRGLDGLSYDNADAGVSVNMSTGTSTGGGGEDSFRGIDFVRGSPFNDGFTGTDRADFFIAGAGEDTVRGGPGFDLIDYMAASGPVHVDLANGTAITPEGNESLIAIEGVSGSPFADTLIGDFRSNFFWGGEGNDTINGAAGIDMIDYGSSRTAIGADFGRGESFGPDHVDKLMSIEGINGSQFGDDIVGGPDTNYIFAGGGEDRVAGLAGSDALVGGAGRDVLDGGEGVDTCTGGTVVTNCEADRKPPNNPVLRFRGTWADWDRIRFKRIRFK